MAGLEFHSTLHHQDESQHDANMLRITALYIFQKQTVTVLIVRAQKYILLKTPFLC